MSLLLNQQEYAKNIEHELRRYAIAINYDWNNLQQTMELANEFASFNEEKAKKYMNSGSAFLENKMNFFGLAQIMLTVMEDGATENSQHIHGGELWKAFGKALYRLTPIQQKPKI